MLQPLGVLARDVAEIAYLIEQVRGSAGCSQPMNKLLPLADIAAARTSGRRANRGVTFCPSEGRSSP